MGCHICIRTGERTCDPEDSELKCMVCGWCERQALMAEVKCDE